MGEVVAFTFGFAGSCKSNARGRTASGSELWE